MFKVKRKKYGELAEHLSATNSKRKGSVIKSRSSVKSSLILFLVLVVVGIALRMPYIINANWFAHSDEAVNAMTLIQMVEQKEFYPFYLGVYHLGLTQGLLGLPFFLIWGVIPLAWKLIGAVEFILYASLIFSAFHVAWNKFSVRKRAWHYILLSFIIVAPPPLVFKASQAIIGGHFLVGIIAGFALLYLIVKQAEASGAGSGWRTIIVLYLINQLGVYTNKIYLMLYPALFVAAIWGPSTGTKRKIGQKLWHTVAILLLCFMLPILVHAALVTYHKTTSYENLDNYPDYTILDLSPFHKMRFRMKRVVFGLLPKLLGGKTQVTPILINAVSMTSLTALMASLAYSVCRAWKKYPALTKLLFTVLITAVLSIIMFIVISRYFIAHRYLEVIVGIAPIIIMLYLLGATNSCKRIITTAIAIYGICNICWLIQFYVNAGIIVPSKDPARWFPVYPSSKQPLVEFALANNITYVHGGYWETYIATWLSGGRLRWASTRSQRMRLLQEEVDRNNDTYWVFRVREDGQANIEGDVPSDLVIWRKIQSFSPSAKLKKPDYVIMIREGEKTH